MRELSVLSLGGVVDEFVYFTVCSEVVDHKNERDGTESGAPRHAATESLL